MTTLKVKMTNYPSPFAQADSADSHASAVDFISEYDADSNGAGVWSWDWTPQIADEWYEDEKWMDDFASNEAIYEETSDKQWEELWQSSSPITEPSRQGDDTEDARHQRWGHLDVSGTGKIQVFNPPASNIPSGTNLDGRLLPTRKQVRTQTTGEVFDNL